MQIHSSRFLAVNTSSRWSGLPSSTLTAQVQHFSTRHEASQEDEEGPTQRFERIGLPRNSRCAIGHAQYPRRFARRARG